MFRYCFAAIILTTSISFMGCCAPMGGCNSCGDCTMYDSCGGPIAGGPIDALRQTRRNMLCGDGCGGVYYGEWRSTPPDCCDPCEFDDCGVCGCGGVGCGRCVQPVRTIARVVAGLYGKRNCGGCGYGVDDCCCEGVVHGDCGCSGCDSGIAPSAPPQEEIIGEEVSRVMPSRGSHRVARTPPMVSTKRPKRLPR